MWKNNGIQNDRPTLNLTWEQSIKIIEKVVSAQALKPPIIMSILIHLVKFDNYKSKWCLHWRHEVVIYPSPMASPWGIEIHTKTINSRPHRFSKPVRSVHYIPIFPLQGAYRLSFSATQGDAIGLEYTTTSWRRRGLDFKQIIL